MTVDTYVDNPILYPGIYAGIYIYIYIYIYIFKRQIYIYYGEIQQRFEMTVIKPRKELENSQIYKISYHHWSNGYIYIYIYIYTSYFN